MANTDALEPCTPELLFPAIAVASATPGVRPQAFGTPCQRRSTPGVRRGRSRTLLDPLRSAGARDPMLDLLDILFAGTPYAPAVRDLRYDGANDVSRADALGPDWTMLRSLLQQSSGM